MRERKTFRRFGLAALGVATALATGCAAIPTESPVVASSPGADDGSSEVRIEARPPQTGATPTQIVEGFLDAMSSYAPGFPLAEEFLMPDARAGWVRTAIEVYNRPTLDQPEPSAAAFPDATQASVRLAGERAARIDAEGRFTAVAPGSEPLEYVLRLERDPAGEWRIDNPPDFLLISSFDLSRTYSPFSTYFPNPEGTVLVPDQIWLPAGEPQLATLLAQALVDGPTDLIGPAGVGNAFPTDTLVGRTVLSGGTLTVPLSGPAVSDTDGAARRLMVAQLAETLFPLPGIDRVSVTIDGEAIDVPDDSSQLSALAGFADPPVYVLADDDVVRSADPTQRSGLAEVPGVLGRGELASRSLAVSLDRTTAATVDETGTQVLRTPLTEEGQPVRVFQGEDIVGPSFDRYGNLWLVDRRSAGGPSSDIRMVQPDGVVVPVAAPDLVGARVTDLKIAADGVRVAVVTEGAAVLRVGHVVRGAAPAIDLTVNLPFEGSVVDAAWAGERELLVVVAPPAGPPRPYSVSVDGSAVTEGSVTGTTSVAAYPSRPAFALTDVRTVLRQTSVLQWDQVTTGKAVTYPG